MSFQVDIRIRDFYLDGVNLQMQTHLVSKIMHQNFAVILQQFNNSKNSFAVLVPDRCTFMEWFMV